METSANPTQEPGSWTAPGTNSILSWTVSPRDPAADPLAHIDLAWKQLALAYAVELGKRSGSARTPDEYMRYVARFLARVTDPSQATAVDVHAFAYGIGASGRDPSAATIAVRLAAVRGFLDFARRMGVLSRNPAADVKTPRTAPPTPRGLSAPELRRLLAAVPETPGGLRDRAIILTMVLTGLRRTEVLKLRAGDLSHDPGTGRTTYRVRTKGGAERHRDLPAPALAALQDALAAREMSLGELQREAPLFPISSHGFYANLRRYATTAGLRAVTPHVLRHSAAKLRRQTGASLEDVSSLLGHRNLSTTARYLARLEGDRDEGWHGVAELLGV